MRTSNLFTTPLLLMIICIQFINMELKMQAVILFIGSIIMFVLDIIFLFQHNRENNK
jgi:membrane-bound ClpP family serine protease